MSLLTYKYKLTSDLIIVCINDQLFVAEEVTADHCSTRERVQAAGAVTPSQAERSSAEQASAAECCRVLQSPDI